MLKKHGKKFIIGVVVVIVLIILAHLGGSAIGMMKGHLGM